jgi:hypothetical protein
VYSSFLKRCSEKKKKVFEVQNMVLGVCNPSRLPVKFGAFASPGFRCKSLIIYFSLRDIVSVIHYDVTICMKLDPDVHIVKHLVFFGKSGVTPRHSSTPAKPRLRFKRGGLVKYLGGPRQQQTTQRRCQASWDEQPYPGHAAAPTTK